MTTSSELYYIPSTPEERKLNKLIEHIDKIEKKIDTLQESISILQGTNVYVKPYSIKKDILWKSV